MPRERPVAAESTPVLAIASITAAARASSAGSASSSVRTAVTRPGARSTRSSPKPTSVRCIWSDQRLVASSMAIDDSTAVTSWCGPLRAISPCAASRSTSTRPAWSVPIDTSPGSNASASLASSRSTRVSAANGSRHTCPSPTAVHGAGGSRSAGAIQRSRFSGLRCAANTVGGVRPATARAYDR